MHVSLAVDRGVLRIYSPDRSVFLKAHRERIMGAVMGKSGGLFCLEVPATRPSFSNVIKWAQESGIRLGRPPKELMALLDAGSEFEAFGINEDSLQDPKFKVPPIPVYKTKPWEHQSRAFWFAAYCFGGYTGEARGGALLALDMGCGKTKVTIDLIQSYGWRRTMIFCPAKVVDVWPYQCDLHAITGAFEVVVLKGTRAERAKTLLDADAYYAGEEERIVYVTNYEILDQKVFKEALDQVDFDAVVLDEGHRIKDPGGSRSKYLSKLADRTKCRLSLTGTPMPNSPLDVYAQCRFLDRSLFGTNFTRFRARYAVLGSINGNMVKVLSYQNEDELAEKLRSTMLQIDSKEVQDLPEEQHIRIPVTLSKKTLKYYSSMEEDFVVYLSAQDEEVVAKNVLVKLGKLQEITGGFLRDPDTQEITELGTEKRDVLEELLADIPLGEPVVVFCRLRPDLDAIKKVAQSCGRQSFEVSGRANELKEWQSANGGEILIAQISAGKEGVDLTRSNYAIYYSLGYQPGEFSQSKKRQNRPGQKADCVHYYHLVATGTVDEQIYRAIRKKQSVIDAVCEQAKGGS